MLQTFALVRDSYTSLNWGILIRLYHENTPGWLEFHVASAARFGHEASNRRSMGALCTCKADMAFLNPGI